MKFVTTIPRNQVVTVSDNYGHVLLVFETASRSTLRFEGVNVSYEPCEGGRMDVLKCPGDADTSRGLTPKE